ncbi:Cinnamoyl-CoA reductase 1 [Linum perenne]
MEQRRESSNGGESVCVTGGSGCIGSWLVSLLLDRGYTVHATVKNLNDEKETKHLLALKGAEADVVKAEDCWTDVEYCKQNGLWYPLSKTLAEKAAWEFSKEKGLDVVVVNPGTVMGPAIPPTLNASMLMILRLLQGCTETYKDFFMGSVHFKDVALAHIMVYENPSAAGRHLCVEAISHYGDFVAKVAELYPEYNVPSLPKDTQPGLLRTKNGAQKLIDMGLEFIPMEQIIKDSVEYLKEKGYLS